MQKIIDHLDLGAKGLWFPVIISILLTTTVLFIRKKNITWREIYITFGVVGFATWFSDAMFARVIDVFDIGHPKKAGLGDILSYTFIPTSLAILYLNYLTKKNKWKLTIIFILLSMLIEFGMIHSGYMKYKGWHWSISIIAFVLAFGFLLPKHISIIRNDRK